MNFVQCPACGAQVLPDTPHACVGDPNVPAIAIPPTFFIDMSKEEWEQLLTDYGRLNEAQVQRLFRMMGVPEMRMAQAKRVNIVLTHDQLVRMSDLREKPIVIHSGRQIRRIKKMRVH